jgi:hypothetical protein
MSLPLTYQEDLVEEQFERRAYMHSPQHIHLHEIELQPLPLPPSSSSSDDTPSKLIFFPQWFLWGLFGVSLCGMISGAYAIEQNLKSVGIVVLAECVWLMVCPLILLVRGKQYTSFRWKRAVLLFVIFAVHGAVWFGFVESSIAFSEIRILMIVFSVIWSPWFVFSFFKLALHE